MNKEFTPYEQAFALKELGFDEPCFALFYGASIKKEPEFLLEFRSSQYDVAKGYVDGVLAPTFSQAFRWFREKYSLNHEISYAGIKGEYHAFVREYVYGNNGNRPSVFSYKEAELECLKKLIEIVKKEGKQ